MKLESPDYFQDVMFETRRPKKWKRRKIWRKRKKGVEKETYVHVTAMGAGR